MPLLPFVEQTALRDLYFDYGVANGRNYYHKDNINGATGKQMKGWLCPSDRTNRGGWPANTDGSITYHNYVGNMGNTAINDGTLLSLIIRYVVN